MKKVLLFVVLTLILALCLCIVMSTVALAADEGTGAASVSWTDVLIRGIEILFGAVLVPLLAAGFAYVRSKTKNEALLAALTEAEKVADQVVAGIQANIVEGLKKSHEDGKLTKDEIMDVAQLAYDGFISDISSKTLTVLSDKADDIEAYIKNLIESRLLNLKNQG